MKVLDFFYGLSIGMLLNGGFYSVYGDDVAFRIALGSYVFICLIRLIDALKEWKNEKA